MDRTSLFAGSTCSQDGAARSGGRRISLFQSLPPLSVGICERTSLASCEVTGLPKLPKLVVSKCKMPKEEGICVQIRPRRSPSG